VHTDGISAGNTGEASSAGFERLPRRHPRSSVPCRSISPRCGTPASTRRAASRAKPTRRSPGPEAARLEAERRRGESEHRAYRTNLLAADLSLAAGEVREARRLLDVTPDRLRGWEWGYLANAPDSSITTLQAPAGDSSLTSTCPDSMCC
jgi:hypothetical protein